MGTILKDKTKFHPRKGNANLENLKKYQGFLGRLKKIGVLNQGFLNFFVLRPILNMVFLCDSINR